MQRADNGWWITDDDVAERSPQLFTAEQIHVARAQIERAVPFVKDPRSKVAIQGGARCGLWPIMLVDYFREVVAFEPDPDNYACCAANAADQAWDSATLRLHRAALGPTRGADMLVRSAESNGLHYLRAGSDTAPGVEVAVTTVDALGYARDRVGALFLDVEGYEHEVLRGAIATLLRSRPVVVVEENALIARYQRERGDVERFLQQFGYRLVAEFYTLPDAEQHDGNFRGSDLIFAVD